MKTKILRNIFISVGVLFTSTQLLPAGTITTFDPPGSTFTVPSAITRAGVIIGSYVDASGVTHGFLRTPSGTFTTFDVPGFTSRPNRITPGGVITGWYRRKWRCIMASFALSTAPSPRLIHHWAVSYWLFLYSSGPPPSVNPAGDIAGTILCKLCGARLPADPRRHLHDHRFPGRVFHRSPRDQPSGSNRGRLL